MLDSSDKKELVKSVTTAEEAIDRSSAIATQLAGGSKYLEDLGVAGPAWKYDAPVKAILPVAPAKLKASITKDMGMKQLARLLPDEGQLVGCTIQVINKAKKCTVFYPGVKPASRSRTWGTYFKQEKVIQHCIGWAWVHHKNKTGNECPYAF